MQYDEQGNVIIEEDNSAQKHPSTVQEFISLITPQKSSIDPLADVQMEQDNQEPENQDSASAVVNSDKPAEQVQCSEKEEVKCSDSTQEERKDSQVAGEDDPERADDPAAE